MTRLYLRLYRLIIRVAEFDREKGTWERETGVKP